ncbi:hypothetical protein [Dokdonella sp.]|uniref:hypothetical protein n=1 Tax=Dokdonella sp. TaxID=2291710 RepID=UPI002F42D36C
MKQGSIWTRDLAPSCSRLGYVEPIHAAERRRRLLRLAPWLALSLLLLWGWDAWLRSERAAIDALAQTDHAEALRRAAVLIGVGVGSAVAFAAATCIGAMLVALRALRAGRWPPADARVWRRTRVIGGACLRVRFGLVLLLAPAAAAFLVHTGAQLVGWAWNTYADARADAASDPRAPATTQRNDP